MALEGALSALGGDSEYQVPPDVQRARDVKANAILDSEGAPQASGPLSNRLMKAGKSAPVEAASAEPLAGALSALSDSTQPPPTDAPSSPSQEKTGEGFWSGLFHGVASVADTAAGVIPATLGTAAYATRRALGDTPDEASRTSQQISGFMDRPFGRAFGVTDTPGYKGEVTNRMQEFIGQNINKGADWISQNTGLPKEDVQNYLSSAALIAGPKAIEAAPVAAKSVVNSVRAQANDTVRPAVATPPPASGYESARATYGQSQPSVSQYASGGSAGTGIIGRLSVASKDLQDDAASQIQEAQQKFGNDWQNHIHWEALDRQLNADSLLVPGRLTQGQASRDGALISEEWNKRSTNGLAPIFEAQNKTQIENLRHIRESTTPDVYSNTPAEHAQTLIDAYQKLYAQDKGAVDAKWNNIRATSSDNAIFDAGQMLKDAQDALKVKKLTAYDPGGQMAELIEDAKRGGLSADGYVNWRQNLGREAMKGGNEGKAASAIIEATNNSPLLPNATQYRDLVNDALASGKALHDKLARDSAYKAVADGNASVKDFVNKFVIQGKPEKVAQMRDNLVGNDVAGQTIRASLIDSLRRAAALDEQYQGNFASKSFNKQLSFITPNARLVMNNGELQSLQSLGDYGTDIQFGGSGSWKNFSNTATELNTPTHAMISKAGNIAGMAAETALAHYSGGASIPLLNVLKSGAQARAAAKAAAAEQAQAAENFNKATRPAAGIIK